LSVVVVFFLDDLEGGAISLILIFVIFVLVLVHIVITVAVAKLGHRRLRGCLDELGVDGPHTGHTHEQRHRQRVDGHGAGGRCRRRRRSATREAAEKVVRSLGGSGRGHKVVIERHLESFLSAEEVEERVKGRAPASGSSKASQSAS
jgi:hypothetical protein